MVHERMHKSGLGDSELEHAMGIPQGIADLAGSHSISIMVTGKCL
jgi:hypothetical protein